MGKKYIVEIGRLERLYKASTSAKGMPNMTWLSPEVDLTPYTEPDLEQVREEAYQEGKKQAKVQAELDVCHDIEKVAKENYKAGLSDAWEAARKILKANWGERNGMFGAVTLLEDIFLDNTPAEAIEKIRQYEQKQEEIKVGDEVVFGNDEEIKAVVIDEADEAGVWLLLSEKGCVERMDGVLFHRTGRHFSELTEIFKKMREE